jgi:hypothetical protein
MEKFKHEEKFLENLSKNSNEFFSMIELSDGHGLSPEELNNKPKFIEFFSDSTQYSNGSSQSDVIYVFDEDIYIYLSKSEPIISSFSCKIYYPIIKKKDVNFFILNLKKLKKNGN